MQAEIVYHEIVPPCKILLHVSDLVDSHVGEEILKAFRGILILVPVA